MKTFTRSIVGIVAAAALLALLAAPAWAIVTETYGVGVVIPYAIYDGSGRDTVVGILVSPAPGRKIYWSFVDANGNLLAGDTINLSVNVLVYSFSLSAALRGTGGVPDAAKGVPGYLILIDDNDGILETGENVGFMAASAFLVDLSEFDAVFLPVIPLNRADLANSNIDLVTFSPNALLSLTNGHYSQAPFVRFLTGPGGNPRTLLIIFTPTDAPTSFEADAYSPSGTTLAGLHIPTTARRLNVIDVGSISELSFNEGYLLVFTPPSARFGLVFALTRSSVVGAEQTIIGIAGQ